ncbi:MAG: phospholipase D-like domain-containing protein [Rhodobacterales bacterium]
MSDSSSPPKAAALTQGAPLPRLREGDTCWTICRADRLAVIVDAADYFSTVRDAIVNARHSVYLIGWDFDTRIKLSRPNDRPDVPNRLGRLLAWAVRRRKDLRIYVLRWDLGALKAVGRGSTTLVILDWLTHRNIRFKLDSAHPTASAHHQKIVVIDDALAFCGGIDMTADRWDTRAHLDNDPGRRHPATRHRYGPWHDMATAVDGAAARALGDLARARWQKATGQTLEVPPRMASPWPERLIPTMRDVDVALSRTAPDYAGQDGIHEIEALYLEAIATARRTIYIESQYFAARRITEALADRLREPDGPEIILINPETANGWLEEEVMGASRVRMLDIIYQADHAKRFRIYTPMTAKRRPIYVHAKVMIVDDCFLKLGSSNLNNRSMGFDTECDLSVEVVPHAVNAAAQAQAIRNLRHDLLAEHLGTDIATVESAHAQAGGSLIGAIERLRSDGRSLVPFNVADAKVNGDSILAENHLLDPERAATRWQGLRKLAKRAWRLIRLAGRGRT